MERGAGHGHRLARPACRRGVMFLWRVDYFGKVLSTCRRSEPSPLPTKGPQSTRLQRCFTLRQRVEASWSSLRSWSSRKAQTKAPTTSVVGAKSSEAELCQVPAPSAAGGRGGQAGHRSLASRNSLSLTTKSSDPSWRRMRYLNSLPLAGSKAVTTHDSGKLLLGGRWLTLCPILYL